jgi:hypothetical protein
MRMYGRLMGKMHCLQCILPTSHQLNAHVRHYKETKMAAGRENDE